MSRPHAAAAFQPSAASAASVNNTPMNAAAPTPNLNPIPIPFAGPFRPRGALPPAPYPALVYFMRPPPVFPPVIPPGAFRGPGVYQPPPPPGVFVPYPGTPFHPFGPPGFPPSIISPPVGVFSHQRPEVIHGICGPVAAVRLPTPPVAPADKPQFKVYVGKIAPTMDNDFGLALLRCVDL